VGLVEHDAFDAVTDVAPVKYVGDVRQRNHHEAPGMSRERRLDTLLHREERQWISGVDPVGIPYCHADLSDSA
jgi:hypothetical protein